MATERQAAIDWRMSPVGVDQMVGERDLCRMIGLAFSGDDFPEQFSCQTTSFSLPELGYQVAPSLSPNEIGRRLGEIQWWLSSLKERKPDGIPEYPLWQVYEVYSVIACNWLSVHGCLGIDGHGRAMVQLLPICFDLAGYPEEFAAYKFSENMRENLFQLVWLNGHPVAGLRIAAGFMDLVKTGLVSRELRDFVIVGHERRRSKADALARKMLAGFLLKKMDPNSWFSQSTLVAEKH
ncbi:MAG: hypothetical protein ABID04_01360 [Patescibacteria group bacterium]